MASPLNNITLDCYRENVYFQIKVKKPPEKYTPGRKEERFQNNPLLIDIDRRRLHQEKNHGQHIPFDF